MSMTGCCITLIFSLIIPHPINTNAQASNFNEQLSLMSMVNKNDQMLEQQMHATTTFYLQHTENEVTTNLRSGKGQSFSHGKHHLKNGHGILNIIGWGTLFPVGVIVARYFRKFPIEYEEWHRLHMFCQISGYILGSIGWGIGLWLGNSSKYYTIKTHRILGILVFISATIQILTAFLQPRREDDQYHKYWEIFHHCLGYVVIALSIANIFQGIIHQSHAEKWRWVYVGVLALLASVAAALEILIRWFIKPKIQQQMPFDDNNNENIYNSYEF